MINNIKCVVAKLSIAFTLLISVVVIANAQSIKNSDVEQVDMVDNTRGIVVIDDQEFHLKLNTKVSDGKKRKLNRYALKVGQIVKYKSSYENKKNYLDSIVIVTK